MLVSCIQIGTGVPADFTGVVAAAYSRACILELADATLVTLATQDVGGLPRGLTLDTAPQFSFATEVEAGAEVALRAGILRIAGRPLRIDLRGARPWRSNLSALRIDTSEGAVGAAWRVAAECVRGSSLDDLLMRAGADAMRDLTAATRALHATPAIVAMRRLVGLGTGLTPAGDDYLVGYLAGLWCTAGEVLPRLAFVTETGAAMKAMASCTHRVSRTYLEAAADGEISERLAVLARAIHDGAPARNVQAATAAAVAVGHTSGACGVLGLLRGTAAWQASAWETSERVP